jgi:hypothetical protein
VNHLDLPPVTIARLHFSCCVQATRVSSQTILISLAFAILFSPVTELQATVEESSYDEAIEMFFSLSFRVE